MTAGKTNYKSYSKYQSGIKDQSHFISLIFTLETIQRLEASSGTPQADY